MLLCRDRTHVAHRVPRVPYKAGLRDQRLVTDERLKVILPALNACQNLSLGTPLLGWS